MNLMSIDIEGMEFDVLRCWPWEKVDVQYILIETDKGDVRAIDSFFHNHGYANIATFLNYSRRRDRHVPLDNLYQKVRNTPLKVPHRRPSCNRADREVNPWCGRYDSWITEESLWTQC